MAQNFNQSSIQSALGVYFKTPGLLSAAFTHVSFSDTENNESLVFLGEKLFDFIISDYVSSRYPFSVGKQLYLKLDDIKKAFDHKGFISEKGLSKYISLSASSESLREDRALHGEVFLAILAAIYKDGGLSSLKAFILPLIRAIDSEDHYPPKKADTKAKAAAEALSRAPENTNAPYKKSQESKAENSSPAASQSEHTASLKNVSRDDIKATPKRKKSTQPEETEGKPVKKGVNLLKAIMLPAKNKSKETVTEQSKAAVSKADEQKVTTEDKNPKVTPRRSFIRDALTPVSLPESMRNPKPRRPLKTSEDNEPSKKLSLLPEDKKGTFESEKSNKAYTDTEDSENYKSLLQEYVQKNIRSANVLIKYNTTRKNGVFMAEVTLDGHSLARAESSVKKNAEMTAARLAYDQLSDTGSSLYSWFSSLSTQKMTPERASENYVSRLNEYYQKKSHSSAAPLIYEPRPSSEKKTFAVAVMFNGEELSVGTGHTVKDAKQDAAKKVCQKLKI